MAQLDVDEVKPDVPRQDRRRDEAFFELLQLRIGDEVCRRAHGIDSGAVLRDDGRRMGPAPGVRKLQSDDEAVVRPEAFAPRGARLVDQAFEFWGRSCRDQQLAWVRTRLRRHRGRFAPQQRGATLRKATPSPNGQLARCAVGVSIASLHRVYGHAVGRDPVADARGISDAREFVAHADRMPLTRDIGAQFVR